MNRRGRPFVGGRIIIEPPSRFPIPDLPSIWESREVLVRFGVRDVTLRYRQTALGIIWVILQPLIAALVFSLVFGRVAHLSSGGVPYLLFSYVGLLPWNMFSGILTRGSGSLVSNAALVSKVYFPRIHVPLSIAVAVMVDFAVSLVFLVVLYGGNGFWPNWHIVFLPCWVLLVLFLATGLASLLAALAVKYRDIQYVVPVALQFLLYASPIAYTTGSVPDKYRIFYDINPLSWLLREFRWSLLRQSLPPTWQIAASGAVCIGVFLICVMLFEQLERGLADVI